MTFLLTRLLLLSGVLFLVTEPAAASLKRLIFRQAYGAGFPPLIQTDADRPEIALFTLSTPECTPKYRAQGE
jgi:hypothetical protein